MKFTVQAYYSVLYTDVDVEARDEAEAVALMEDRVNRAMRRLSSEFTGLYSPQLKKILKPIQKTFTVEE